ncbi:MAG: thiamine phosphate synthase [Planctomycetota bacterium]
MPGNVLHKVFGEKPIVNEELSPGALRAIANAKRFAHGRDAAEADLQDLLAGLLVEEESQARRRLRELAVDPIRLARELRLPQYLGIEPNNLPLAPRFTSAISRAKQLAVSYNRLEPACSEELLVSVIEQWDEAQSVFVKNGLDTAAVLEEYHSRRRPEVVSLRPEDLVGLTSSATDDVDLARIVDANANRAREALRVLEDHARFVLDDGALSGRIKQCRHQLREALAFLPIQWLILSRETDRDVGTGISTPGEFSRVSLTDVVKANAKRAQEALRVLEECAKIESDQAAKILESSRYELYSIERLLFIADRARDRLRGALLYWLVDPSSCASTLDWMVERAISGGVDVVQLRFKTATDRELLAVARSLRAWTRQQNAMFIVNDRPDIARLSEADGVHVGQEELTVRDARRIVGPDAIVGVSTHSIDQARAAVRDGADYLGVGPVFPSNTKQFEDFPGLAFVRQAAEEISLPFFCIGGIHGGNLDQVRAAGGRRIAVSSAISAESDPLLAARGLKESLADEPSTD